MTPSSLNRSCDSQIICQQPFVCLNRDPADSTSSRPTLSFKLSVDRDYGLIVSTTGRTMHAAMERQPPEAR